MRRFVTGAVKQAARALVYGILGGFVVLVVVFVVFLENRPDLKVWHKAELDAEFTADSPARSFEDYLAVEAQLFAQLDQRVFDLVQPEDRRQINRYHRGSLSDPARWSTDWNRTFEFSADRPSAGVLLLHGMSDSPYSLRHMGQRLRAEGAWVIGLRLPGHGTAPSGLVDVRWEDMAAAVLLAVRHLREKVSDRPLYLVGYSTGAALSVHYTLSALGDTTLPSITGLVLLSPAIGVTPTAALAVWQARLGHMLGLQKLEWLDILPEYDPFKYGSFAVNAGDQVYRLTGAIQTQLEAHGSTGALDRFPPVIAFQSVVDATVSTPALVERLFNRLPGGGHELVLFDINRMTDVEYVLAKDPKPYLEAMLDDASLPFTVSFLTNENEESRHVVVRRKRPDDPESSERSVGLTWPNELYSLSHVALPIPANDPLYGRSNSRKNRAIPLGNIALRGERGVLQIPAAAMLRLRWNPFYPYIERRLLEFVRLEEPLGVGTE